MEGKEAPYLIALACLLKHIGKFAQQAGFEELPLEKPLEEKEKKILALADQLATGEQLPPEGEEPRQLRSIFCSLTAEGQKAKKVLYWPLKPLQMSEDVIFPQEEAKPEAIEEAYKKLGEEFKEQAEILRKTQGGNLPVYLESLLLLLQRYAWCIPSALPDVSLYDHARIAAGLAVCLLDQDEATLDALEKLQARRTGGAAPGPEALNKAVALLVGGDISGVQDFIYTITARGATSALRGRSFYLQLLTEAVARYVLRRLELPITNLIYQGGGGFYLLARPSDQARLDEIRREVSRILLAHHRGDLYLALAFVPLKAADFYEGRISGRWEELGQRLQKAKQRRFAELESELVNFFQPEGRGGDEKKQCQVCGREHECTDEYDGVRKCPPCFSYEELGDDLRRARYLWMSQKDPDVPTDPLEVLPGGWEEVLAAFGMEAGVVKEIGDVPNTDRPRWILALKDEAMKGLKPDSKTVVGRRFLVNVTPILTEEEYKEFREKIEGLSKPGSVKDFSVMEYQSKGLKRLGVLRMDVDNLGKLFAQGFGDKAGLSRVAALSFAISLFFEGWVEVLAERLGKDEQGHDRLYSIYSGGDDLFFVGSWDAVVELARAIRADFSRFVANHPGLHTSAGIALVGGKYPLYQAAEDAGRAEKQAKDLRWKEDGHEREKDAISFLGQALPWRRFGIEECKEGMDTVHSLAHLLFRLTSPEDKGGEDVPRALLQMLIRLQEQHQETAERRARVGEDRNKAGAVQTYYGPWIWRGYYFLKRMAQRLEKERPEAARKVDELAEKLHGENFRAIEWIGLAARWAELLGRERE
jgi:CRISPR-associated protein Csm1